MRSSRSGARPPPWARRAPLLLRRACTSRDLLVLADEVAASVTSSDLEELGSCALHSRSRSPSTRWPIPPSNARSVRPESQPAGRADIRGEGRIRQPPGGSRTTYLVGQIGRGGVLRSGLGSRPRPLLRRRSCPGVPRQPRVFWVWLLGPLGAILAIPLAILAKAWWTPIPEPCRRTRLAREGAHRAVTYRLSAGSRTPKRATNQVSVVVEILRTG
jgi:hypothetical protein